MLNLLHLLPQLQTVYLAASGTAALMLFSWCSVLSFSVAQGGTVAYVEANRG